MRTPRWLVVIYTAVLIIGILLALPNLFSKQFMEQKLPWYPDTRVTLGLDLQGGSYLVLEVDQDALKKEQVHNTLENVRAKLRSNQIQTSSLRSIGDTVVVGVADATERAKALGILKELISPIGSSGFAAINDLDVTEQGETIRVAITQGGIDYRVRNAIEQSLEIIRRRVDEVGVAEPSIQKVGADRIMVQLPGLQNPGQLRALLGKTAKMTFHLVDTTADLQNPPLGVTIMQGYDNDKKTYAVEDQVSLDGNTLTDARAFNDLHVPGGQVKILFKLNSEGANIFREITKNNIGRPFAIVLDGKVLTAPVIQSIIPNGSGEITGSFTMSEATQLSALLRAGALPAPLTVVEERTVGPDLGADAIKMGLYTGIAGFLLVAVFVFLLYGVWGLIADTALALHTVLTFAALSILGATLTLPGIAGIILGIGVAVDANILINERIREESRKGLGSLAALDKGFNHAFATIIDANVTALIATVLLYWQGTGPVRGFAVTMFLGIVISMFTDITLVRIIMVWVVKRWKMSKLHIQPFLNFIPQHTNFRFMNARFAGIGVSILLSIASLILFFKPGLNYGIDFKGGIQIQITTQEKPELVKLRGPLNNLGVGEVAMQSITNENSVMIRVQRQEGGEAAQTAAADKVRNEIQKIYPTVKFGSTDIVGPKVSGELARNGFIAVILAALAMTIYIWWRFEWFFAVGAIVTLVLDTTKMVGFFALFQLDFNLTAIAALLTIVGYSVNDKVVVYDRMRENLRLYKKISLREIIDMSINQVLVRCIFTSMTTVLAMLPMAIWGGSAVHNFAVPMVVGIIVATSSSIFIAAPILLLLGDWWNHHHKGRTHDGSNSTVVKV